MKLFLISLLILIFGCGKYSPAVSPDTLRPAALTVESVQVNANNRSIKFLIQKPLRLVNQTEYELPESVACIFQSRSVELLEIPATVKGPVDQAGSGGSSDKLVVECDVPKDFIGTVRLVASVEGRTGVPSNPVRIYNKEVLEAFVVDRK